MKKVKIIYNTPERTSEIIDSWQKEHPGYEIISVNGSIRNDDWAITYILYTEKTIKILLDS